MFLHFCGPIAAAVQALTLASVMDGPPVPVGVAWVWYGASALFLAWAASIWSKLWIWVCLRCGRRQLLEEFRLWGIEWDFGGWIEVITVLFATGWCVGTSWLTVVIVVCSLGDFDPVIAYSALTVLWSIAFWTPVLVVHGEFDSLRKKAIELRGLPQVFCKWFPRSEVLSMYECLHAPGVPRSFWNEYKMLPIMQVSEVNNRRFRARVEPYVSRDNARLQRTILFIAALAVLVALPTVLDILIGGEPFLDWLGSAFATPRSE